MNNAISHAATLVVLRKSITVRGGIEIVSFLYKKISRGRPPFSSWKFPTETGEVGETRWATAANGAVRELSQTPDDPGGFTFRALGVTVEGEPEPFLVSRVPGDPGKGSEWHDKCVYILRLDDSSVANMRVAERWDSNDELLGIPEFVEAGELWRRMLERGQPFHRAVLLEVIRKLAHFSADTFELYRLILEDPRTLEAVCSRGQQIRFL